MVSSKAAFTLLFLVLAVVAISGCTDNVISSVKQSDLYPNSGNINPTDNGGSPSIDTTESNAQVIPWYSGGPVGELNLANFAAAGTKAPYNCTLVNGTQPDGFALVGCKITGKVADLAPGTTEIIQPPFWVSISDSSSPVITAVVEISLRFTQNNIVMILKAGTCKAGEQCSVELVESVTGGQAPYHFQLGSLADGAPPMGMTLNPQNGALSGTPRMAGTYSFSLCAVDTTGVYRCKQASVTVDAGAQPETWSGTFTTTGRNLCNDQGYLDGTGTITFTVPKSLAKALTDKNDLSEIRSWTEPTELNSGTLTWTETVAATSPQGQGCVLKGGTTSFEIKVFADRRGFIGIDKQDFNAEFIPGTWNTPDGSSGSGSGGGIWYTDSVTDDHITGTLNLDPGSGTFDITKSG